MFSDFKKAFVKRPQFKSAPPQAVLDTLNKDLPEGFKYRHTRDGFCVLANDEEFVVNSSRFVLPNEAKEVFGEKNNLSYDEIMQYAYNSQKEIIIKPEDDGTYVINGNRFRADELIKAPLRNLTLKENHLVIVAPKFSEPFTIIVEGNGEIMELQFERKPHNSIDTYCFETVADSPLHIKYQYNVNTFSCVFSVDINKSIKSVSTTLAANKIFNSFVVGDVKINGVEMGTKPDEETQLVSEDTLSFWSMLQELEKVFLVQFDASQDILVDDVNRTYELFTSLVEHKPFKQYKTYNNLKGSGTRFEYENFEDLKGKEMYFEYVESVKFDLLGIPISVVSLVGIHGAVIDEVSYGNNESTDEIKIDVKCVPGKRMYSSTMHFLNEEVLKAFRNDVGHIEVFEKAKEIKYINGHQ